MILKNVKTNDFNTNGESKARNKFYSLTPRKLLLFAVALLPIVSACDDKDGTDAIETYNVTLDYQVGEDYSAFYPIENLNTHLNNELVDTIFANNIREDALTGLDMDKAVDDVFRPAVEAVRDAGKVFWCVGNEWKYVNRISSENLTYMRAIGAEVEDWTNSTHSINGVSFEMVKVAGGTFMMGSDDEYSYSDEHPVHDVTLSSFSIGKYEVTRRLWKAVMGEDKNPSYLPNDDLPVENVSWNDAIEFIAKLNELTEKNYRLPTEAEWEYAARGGNQSKGYLYSGSDEIDDVAWYDENNDSYAHVVGTKLPNELGIYDMTGNVWEWCSDWYENYSSEAQNNPAGPTSGAYRVLRGGSWDVSARHCRTSNRYRTAPSYSLLYFGFRLVLP